MFRSKILYSFGLLLVLALVLTPFSVMAEEGTTTPTETKAPELLLTTQYPSQEIGIGETVTIRLELSGNPAQIAKLEVDGVPEGWTANFRGGGHVIHSVYVKEDAKVSFDLRIETGSSVEAGTYDLTIKAIGDEAKAELPVELIVKDKTPPKLTLSTDLPTLRGTPTTTFRYNVRLSNDGDEDLSVNLSAEAPSNFIVTFKLTGKEVNSFPINAGETKSLSVEVKPISDVQAGSYDIRITALGGETSADLSLTAEIAGQPQLSITTPDGRLSGQANAGKETPISLVVRNTGTASAVGVKLSGTAPSNWKVEFDPKEIPEIPSGQQVEVTAKITPPDKAIAGDYSVTFRAESADGPTEKADFRITVVTSTMWGIIGIALIAVAVGVVAVAVMRFGRR